MTTARERWPLATLVLTAALVGAACGGGVSEPAITGAPAATSVVDDGETVEAGAGSPEVGSEEPAADIDAESGSAGSTVDELPNPQFQKELREMAEYEFRHDPGLLEAEYGTLAPLLLEPGTHTTDAMDTPMTFTLDQHWRLISESTTFMVLVDHERAADLWDLPLVQFNRPFSLTDATTTSADDPGDLQDIAGWDFDAWFDAHPGLDVIRTGFEVGGIPSVRYEISYPEDSDAGFQCGPSDRCTPIVFHYGERPFLLQSNELVQLWVIPQADLRPITAVVASESATGWDGFDVVVEELMASIEFGDVQPVSIPEPLWEAGLPGEVPSGTTWIPILGGVQFELEQERFIAQNRGWSWIEFDEVPTSTFPSNIEVAAAVETIDDIPIGSAEELAELLVDQGGGTRLADRELFGRPAVVVDMRGVVPGVPIFRHVDVRPGTNPGIAAWNTLDYVEVWAVDTPEGVLILTGEADTADGLDQVMEIHARLRQTLTLAPR
jgi:hypothetical protein